MNSKKAEIYTQVNAKSLWKITNPIDIENLNRGSWNRNVERIEKFFLFFNGSISTPGADINKLY